MSDDVRSDSPTYAVGSGAREGRERVDAVAPLVDVLCLVPVEAVLEEDDARTADIRSLA